MQQTAEHKTVFSKKQFEELFPVVQIEKILSTSGFMQFKPKTENQTRVYNSIMQAKESGMKNFRVPTILPSFSDNGEYIIYEKKRDGFVWRKAPAWWKEALEAFMPIKHSRMGRMIEFDVFLGARIKYLVEEKKFTVEQAWSDTCDGNKRKWCIQECHHHIISDNEGSKFFVTGGGSGRYVGKVESLADVSIVRLPGYKNCLPGWMVMDE